MWFYQVEAGIHIEFIME